MILLHIARIDLTTSTGMGRITSMWKYYAEQMGHTFLHVGSKEVNKNAHQNLWGWYAVQHIKKQKIKADILLVHEPFGGFFKNYPAKLVIYSHGIEERAWKVNQVYQFEKLTIKSKLLPPYLRFLSNRIGFKNAHLIFASNSTDKNYLIRKGINADKIFIFNNGYHPINVLENKTKSITVLFNATWLPRKGTALMYIVFNKLLSKHKSVNLILAGTVFNKEEILKGFEKNIHAQIQVISSFKQEEEYQLYQAANIFVLPSYYEGQSVALTQAMVMGLCPVVSNNCGQIDFVKHQENGLVFETGNVDCFFEQLIYLIEHPQKIKEFGQAAKASVDWMQWENVCKEIIGKMEALYN